MDKDKERKGKESIQTLITEQQINVRVKELAKEIADVYQNKNLLLVGVLRGSFVFLADLIRTLDDEGLNDLEVDFMAVTSYDLGQESSRQPKITKDLETDIKGRHVLLVEDIIDTGYSLDTLIRILKSRDPASVMICCLTSKPDRREITVPIDFLGFDIPNQWIEGYGLDSEQKGRGRRQIVVKN